MCPDELFNPFLLKSPVSFFKIDLTKFKWELPNKFTMAQNFGKFFHQNLFFGGNCESFGAKFFVYLKFFFQELTVAFKTDKTWPV